MFPANIRPRYISSMLCSHGCGGHGGKGRDTVTASDEKAEAHEDGTSLSDDDGRQRNAEDYMVA